MAIAKFNFNAQRRDATRAYSWAFLSCVTIALALIATGCAVGIYYGVRRTHSRSSQSITLAFPQPHTSEEEAQIHRAQDIMESTLRLLQDTVADFVIEAFSNSTKLSRNMEGKDFDDAVLELKSSFSQQTGNELNLTNSLLDYIENWGIDHLDVDQSLVVLIPKKITYWDSQQFNRDISGFISMLEGFYAILKITVVLIVDEQETLQKVDTRIAAVVNATSMRPDLAAYQVALLVHKGWTPTASLPTEKPSTPSTPRWTTAPTIGPAKSSTSAQQTIASSMAITEETTASSEQATDTSSKPSTAEQTESSPAPSMKSTSTPISTTEEATSSTEPTITGMLTTSDPCGDCGHGVCELKKGEGFHCVCDHDEKTCYTHDNHGQCTVQQENKCFESHTQAKCGALADPPYGNCTVTDDCGYYCLCFHNMSDHHANCDGFPRWSYLHL